MMTDGLYTKLNALREEYRRRMNAASDTAQKAAAEDDMREASIASTESARYMEAFHALNRAINIVEEDARI